MKIIILGLITVSSFVSLAHADFMDRLAGSEVNKAIISAQEEVADRIINDVSNHRKAENIRIVIARTVMDWDGEFTRLLTEKAVNKKRLLVIDPQVVIPQDREFVSFNYLDRDTAETDSAQIAREYDLILKVKITERKLLPGKRKILYGVYTEIIDPSSRRIVYAKRYKTEKDVEGKYSWEEMNEWIKEKVDK